MRTHSVQTEDGMQQQQQRDEKHIVREKRGIDSTWSGNLLSSAVVCRGCRRMRMMVDDFYLKTHLRLISTPRSMLRNEIHTFFELKLKSF